MICDHESREKISICLPKVTKTQIAISTITPLAKEAVATNTKAHLLIVEDNVIAARAVQASLNRLNCVSDIAETGMNALQMVEHNSYDLILMDIGLPDIDGIEATKRIRALANSAASQVPIVALTGHASREESLAAGMQAMFSKPLSLPKLEAILQQYVYKPRKSTGIGSQKN
jgi:two-component system aerobic respiration control sensor histidine kinase ArcB